MAEQPENTTNEDVFPLGYTIDGEVASTPAREDGSEQQDVIDETRMEGSTIQITDETTDENPKTEKNDPMMRILNMLSGMDKKISGMDKKISGMDKKMSEMNERWEDRFEKLETKWDRKVEDLKQATANLEIETKNLAVRMVKDEEKIEKAGEILRVENKMTDHIERLETKVDKKLDGGRINISIRVENIEDGVNHRLEDLASRLNVSMELNHRLEDLASRLNVSMEQSILPSYNNPIFKESLPKFYSNNVVNAMTYLSNIKKVLANVNSEHRKFELFIKKVLANVNSEHRKFELLRASLKESALNWWDMISEDVATFEEFEREFINQYWGQTQQMRARQDLMFGSYRVGGYESRENYIIKKYSIVRHLTPKMVEEDIVTQLARHFDKESIGESKHQNNASNNGQNFNQQRWRNPEYRREQTYRPEEKRWQNTYQRKKDYSNQGKDYKFEEEVRRVREEVRHDKSTGTIPKDKRQISNLEMEKKKRE
ncbi:hypothetical protein QE152_g24568 [Popillia japonica]|uniref:Uncharacterized protein n=1 Tax=Popillia japonica TaxID=7064 RepID=A0AAW1KAS3_POPJA